MVTHSDTTAMAATRAKRRRVEPDDFFDYESWDCLHDFSTHVTNMNRMLESRTEKFNYFATLSHGFVVHNPLADPDVVNFISDLHDSVKPQLLNLQEENRVASNEMFDGNAEYKIFLDHLRIDGNSYVLDIPEDGIFVKYEPAIKCYASPPGTLSVSDNTNDGTNYISFDTSLNSEAEELHTSTGRRRKHSLQTNVGSEAEKSRGRKRRQADANNAGVQTSEAFRVKEEEEDYVDDPPDLKRPQEEPVVNVDQWWHEHTVTVRKPTEFRDKLTHALKKPYCEEEYMRLLEQLSQRKPVQNCKELRGCTKVYEVARPGKSFLDHHADLAKRIDSVRDDHPRVLNLLRGFFYWLKNLSHEGAFLPWKDTSCLEVLPQ